MQKQTLDQLLTQSLFRIPDYQRGYAWEDKQWSDFVQDIDALVEEDTVKFHYTGTVVTYQKTRDVIQYDLRKLPIVDVVDGQQRLTSCTLYLSVIIDSLIRAGEAAYEREISSYLYSVDRCKLELNNDTGDLFHDLLKSGAPMKAPSSVHQTRLVDAHGYFRRHIEKRCAEKGAGAVDYLKSLYDAITRKLIFTWYTIDEEAEIGMTFELMNSRGKELSVLELLKNYLMHWIYRNVPQEQREGLTNRINKNWKDAYSNIGATKGKGWEDQCLRIAWILFCSHTPQNWSGYEGFKGDAYIPLRKFREPGGSGPSSLKSKEETQAYLARFGDGLSLVSKHYAQIVAPSPKASLAEDEYRWLTKIHNTGNIANFLPLMTAARIRLEERKDSEEGYIQLLQALECYAYRVFIFEEKRSNCGKSSFYRWADEVFKGKASLEETAAKVRGLIEWYAPTSSFHTWSNVPQNWYNPRRLLRYTLYEYELHLLATDGKGKAPVLKWPDLMSDATIEHILPQNPDERSEWLVKWSNEDRDGHLHDIGNLVLTQNNSNYRNFDFTRKKGQPGISPSYSHSDIRQERDISAYADWTREELMKRREKVVEWLQDRWKSGVAAAGPAEGDLDDQDGTESGM